MCSLAVVGSTMAELATTAGREALVARALAQQHELIVALSAEVALNTSWRLASESAGGVGAAAKSSPDEHRGGVIVDVGDVPAAGRKARTFVPTERKAPLKPRSLSRPNSHE